MAHGMLQMLRTAAALLIVLLPMATPVLGDQTGAGDTGAVYEYLRWNYAITPGGYTATNSVRVTILAERGQEYARLSFFENSYHKLKSVTIRVYDASGKLAYERHKGDLEKMCGYNQTAFYSDDCHYFGTFQRPAYPYSIEYQWVVESKSLFFLRGCDFQRSAPVKLAVYMLETSGTVQFDYRTYGLAEGIEPQISPDGRCYTWTVKDLPALSDLEMLPPGCPEPARLAVTSGSIVLDGYYFDGSSWNAVGRSLAQLCEDRFLPVTDAPPAPTGQALAEAARACYESVRDEIRYVAIEVGLGGWRPHPAALTQERRFGDCKDNSILLVSRLRNAGVPAWPVHVLTRDQGPVDPEFPAFDFNHVITLALVGDDSVWLDPTCSVCPYGELPSNDRDIHVLAGGADGGRLCRIPPADPAVNVRTRSARLHLGADLSLSLSAEVTAVGAMAQYLRNVLPPMDKDETARFIENLLPGGSKRFAVEAFEIRDLLDLDRPVTISIRAGLHKPARRIGNAVFCVPFVMAELTGYETISLDGRTLPVSAYSPHLDIEEVAFTWDSALAVDSVIPPGSDSLILPFAEIRTSVARDERAVALRLEKRYLVDVIPVDQFEAFADFRDKIRDLHDRHIKVFVR